MDRRAFEGEGQVMEVDWVRVFQQMSGAEPPPSRPPPALRTQRGGQGGSIDFVAPRGGASGWCATGTSGSPKRTLWLVSEEQCASECVQDPRCHAYEHGLYETNHRGHKWCQLQYVRVTHAVRKHGFVCKAKVEGANSQRGPQPFWMLG